MFRDINSYNFFKLQEDIVNEGRLCQKKKQRLNCTNLSFLFIYVIHSLTLVGDLDFFIFPKKVAGTCFFIHNYQRICIQNNQIVIINSFT